MQKSLPIAKARGMLGQIVNRAAFGGERIRISKNGKDIAAVIAMNDLATLQKLEDQLDLREAEKRLANKRDRVRPFRRAR